VSWEDTGELVKEGEEGKRVLVERWRTCEFFTPTGLTWAPPACFLMNDNVINPGPILATKTVLECRHTVLTFPLFHAKFTLVPA
jgi:hypothetical protein